MPRGINRLENLSSGINIITGPNGTGKSSTARYIHKLVWREPMASVISGEASFEIDQDQWVAGTEGGTSSFQKNGIPATPAGLPAKEAKPAYMLALHDLVAAKDKELAGEMIRESIGGYDLVRVKERFNYNSSIKSTRSGEYTDFRNALQKINNILSAQRTLKNEEEKLSDLRNKLEKTNLARKEEAFYTLCRDYLKASECVQKLDTEFRDFPPSIQKTKDDDLKRLDSYEDDITKADKAIQEASAIIAKNKERILLIKLPDDDIDEATMNVLEHRVNDLGQLERDIAEESKSKTDSETRARESLRGIDSEVDEEAWQGIDLPAVLELDAFLENAYRAYYIAEMNEQKINALKKEIDSLPKTESSKIIRGMVVLQAWLKNDKSFLGISHSWFFALSGVAIVAAAAAWLMDWPAMALGVAAIAAVTLAGYFNRPRHTEQSHESDYDATGLKQPCEWAGPAVLDQLENLSDMLTLAKKRENLQQSLRDIEADKTAIDRQLATIKEQHDALRRKLHAVPCLPQNAANNFAGLHYFMIRIKVWQEHHAKARASEANIIKLNQEHHSLLETINNTFAQFGSKPPIDQAEAKAELDSLKQKNTARKNALNEIRQQEIILDNNEQKKQDAEGQLKAIYQRLELEVGMRHEVSRLINLLPGFKNVQRELDHEQRILKSAKQQLESHQLFDERRNEIQGLDIDSTEIKISECADIYAERDGIVEKIKEITLKVDAEKESRDMEFAMHNRDTARNELESLFEQNLASVTGQLIHDELSTEVRENTMPEVFSKAKERFNKITQGRYELIVDHAGDGAFRAIDKLLDRSQELDELSTGTRLQLLLAVRLAYIESKEAGLMLPLLADEVLANSDDLRAKAIIEALIEISRTGRQVFYFTARENEVAHWRAVSKNKQEQAAIRRLTGHGNEEVAQTVADYEMPQITFLEQIPEPGTLNHKEYSKKLMIPPFDPVNDKAEQLHPWYLTEDNHLLYNILTQGIHFWGQLKNYVSHSGIIAGLDKQTLEKMQQKVQLLNYFCELYQTGRPKKIGIEVLKDSNAVKNNFVDKVGNKLKEMKGDPEALIQSLEAGKVARFRTSNIEELKNYFIEKGYIDNREVYSDDEIKLRMLAYQSQLGIQPDDAESFLNLILKPVN